MRSTEFIPEDELSPQLQDLIVRAQSAGNKMAASKMYRYQLYVPRADSTLSEDFKPNAERWTSTAIKRGNTYTSQWVEWCWREGRMTQQWIAPRGTLYRILPGAKILHIGSDDMALKIAKILGHTFPSQYARLHYPWELLKEHFDAVHYPARLKNTYNSRSNNILMSLWDVESTAWYNTRYLQEVGQVSVEPRKW